MEPLYKPAGVEGRWQRTWEEEGLYNADPEPGRPSFVIAHPPPNVTGELHLGHALQLSLADLLIRMRRMQGYNALFQPGYDHAGISTQNAVEKHLATEGRTRQQLGRDAFEARVWEWLHRRTSPEEVLLRRLRNVSSVELFHPATLTAERAGEMWSDYLARRQRYHRIWLTANLLTTPVSLLLAPIPGPNIIGYWFLYRAICHVLALLGIQRVRAGGDLTTIFHASAALDEPLAGSHAEHIARVAADFGLSGLEDYLTRVAAKGVGARDTPLAVP